MKRIAPIILALAAPVHAGEPAVRSLRVVNDTGSAVNQLFVSGSPSNKLRAKVSGIFGAPDDEQDRLDARMLPRGGSIVITLKGDRCRYDIRAILENGSTYSVNDFDVCARSTWNVSGGTRR